MKWHTEIFLWCLVLFSHITPTICTQCQCDSGRESIRYLAHIDGYKRDTFYHGNFDDDFIWGAATAAYQVEGGYNEDGKGWSIWDEFTHTHNINQKNASADITCDSYHKIDEDIDAMKRMHLTHYRFSLAWTRFFPDGITANTDPNALVYYDTFIDKLRDNNIEPMITLFHWDTPNALQEQYGGWNSREIVEPFTKFAETVFERYSDKVKFWFTFNEPYSFCVNGHDIGVMAPGKRAEGYNCAHHQLLAHAEVYHMYDQTYRTRSPGGEGKISLTCIAEYAEPQDRSNPDHLDAADRFMQFFLGWYFHPIYSQTGDYPAVMREYIDRRSPEGASRLPTFSPEEIAKIKGAADFMAIQHYTSRVVVPGIHSDSEARIPVIYTDAEVIALPDPVWPNADPIWLRAYPAGIRRILNWVGAEYGSDWDIYITENGVASPQTYNDFPRIQYLRTYIDEILKAAREDGMKIKGYIIWSIMDNFEWSDGYKDRFGMHYIDFDAPDNEDGSHNRERKPRRSLDFWNQLVADNGFPGDNAPENNNNDLVNHETVWSFDLGVGSTAFQSEGAYESRLPTIWDDFLDDKAAETWRGDLPANSVNDFKGDVAALVKLGVQYYDFSISWARLSDGNGGWNPDGVQFYNDLIDELKANGIEPHATLYYWDLPSVYDWEGETAGLLNDFELYAKFCFETFGDRVMTWQTIARPQKQAIEGYDIDTVAPILRRASHDKTSALYKVVHAQLLAHEKAYTAYKSTGLTGKVGIILDAGWFEAFDDEVSSEAVDRLRDFYLGWVIEPFLTGDYPAVMRTTVGDRLPTFAGTDMTGKLDFVAVDYNRMALVLGRSADNDGEDTSIGIRDQESVFDQDADVWTAYDWRWPTTGHPEERFNPAGLENMLVYMNEKLAAASFGVEKVMLSYVESEKDASMTSGDKDRQKFLAAYINRLTREDFTGIKHVTIYSLVDSIEWENLDQYKRGLVDKGYADMAYKLKRSGVILREMTEERIFRWRNWVCHYNPDRDNLIFGTFNEDFLFGAATAAYQVEGGYDEDGKGENIWDEWTANCRAANCATGNIACDSYHRIPDDVTALKKLNAQFYRFSIGWSRVIPCGKLSECGANQAGLDYYHNLIDALLAEGMLPMVTLYHWDIPTGIEDAWMNENIVEYFSDYADLVFGEFGDKVKHWITFNEPSVFVYQAYEDGGMAPGNENSVHGVTAYQAGHNVILCHGHAYRLYQSKYNSDKEGVVGITLNMGHNEPREKFNVDDREAGDRGQEFYSGVWAHPIFKRDYPEIIKYRVGDRLPKFTEEELDMLEKSSDFYGVNHYTSGLTGAANHWPASWCSESEPSQYCDNPDAEGGSCDEWEYTGSGWFRVAPWPFRNLLRWIDYQYDGIPIFVTENGYSTRDEQSDPIYDPKRAEYYTHYINQMLRAVKQDGVNMMGYAAWSLMDNFEWGQGYDERFGLFYVNHSTRGDRIDTLDRVAKYSVGEVAKIYSNRGWPEGSFDPDQPDPEPVDPTEVPVDPTEVPGSSGRSSFVGMVGLLSMLTYVFSL